MIRMRVVITDHVLAPLSSFSLNANLVSRVDVVAIVGRIAARIASLSNRRHYSRAIVIYASQEYAAAFVGIGFFAVLTDCVVVCFFEFQHIGVLVAGFLSQERKSKHPPSRTKREKGGAPALSILRSRNARSNTCRRSRRGWSRLRLPEFLSTGGHERFSGFLLLRLRPRFLLANLRCATFGAPWRRHLRWRFRDSGRPDWHHKFWVLLRWPCAWRLRCHGRMSRVAGRCTARLDSVPSGGALSP